MSFLSWGREVIPLAAPADDGPGNPWFSWRYVHDNADILRNALEFHAGITARAVLIALVVALPLAVVSHWWRPPTGPVLALSGLTQVPGEVRDAAAGMGYGRFGRLLRIELPLALPGILTGLRLATVSTVALVTVGGIIGRGGLGDLILGGFRNNFYKAQILTASILCVLLALVLDLALAGLGRALTPWTRERRS